MDLDTIHFAERVDRSRYIAARFAPYLVGSVLDVGCDKAVLRGLLPNGVRYTGIDISGTPDLTIDLERTDKLPFDNGAFHTTVCSDVLEHLDNVHHIFGELVRVTQKHLIISLPNNWANARRPIERGKGSIAHYGLPPRPPADRHKWFFGFTEAVAFLKEQEQLFPVTIVRMIANEKPRLWPVRVSRHLRYPVLNRYRNRYAHTVWAVFEKRLLARSRSASR